MSGSIPQSIVTYDYQVSPDNSKFINLSFPFKVLITDIWFTGDYELLSGTAPTGTVFQNSGRRLLLAAQKSKNPRVALSQYDPPSDWAPFFGVTDPESQTGANFFGDESLKPYMWLGIPEDADQELYADGSTQWIGNINQNQQSFRSSTRRPPAFKESHNPYVANDGWNSNQFAANKYKTHIGVMNPGDVLNMFVYPGNDGDWTDYNGEGFVTIHVAYTGVAPTIDPADEPVAWTAWWED